MKLLILAAATLLAVASPATAAAPPDKAGVPPPPKTLDAAGIQAWIDANLAHEGWALLEVDAVGVTFGGPTGVTTLADGTRQAQLRREYFGPDKLGPGDSRSTLQTWNIDCKGPVMRITAMEIFALNNLGGISDRRENPAAPWAPPRPGSMNTQIVGRICQASPSAPKP